MEFAMKAKGLTLRVVRLDDVLLHEQIEKSEWMKTKLRERHVRFYQEAVFLFDE
jgi:hypothetical protein